MPPTPTPDSRSERTVTFLFTDIERSTSLWVERPEAMRAAMEEHDHTLRPLFVEYGGHVFRAVGDAFYVAFGTVSDALRAAFAAQTTLASLTAAHPERPEVRVRMAIHAGEAHPRDNDYVGLALSRTARLRDAAHGGQVVVTSVAAQLAGEGMPTGAALRDLGTHSLRDFPVAESIFQLVHPDLLNDFPPLRTGTATPHNLPRPLTSFVGRNSEVEQLQRLLPTTPLLTLTGAGGCGKTRLSLEVAGAVFGDFPGGVWFADLSSVYEGGLIEQTVAAALAVRPPPGQTHGEGLRDRLRTGKEATLLILDNCEQVAAGCAFFAESLLRDCPNLHLLTTSREVLGVPGEKVWPVPTLRLAEKNTAFSLPQLLQSEAAQLFVERARAAAPTFASDDDVPHLLSICQQLEGIPLALEIAASWAGMLGPAQIAERIRDRAKLLRAANGARTIPLRQRTLRGAIEGSYDLLTEGEQTLMRRLSVFRGGWTLEAIEAVCVLPNDTEDYLTGLYQLVRKSLVIAEPNRDDITRFRFLETIAQFAREMLEDDGETEMFHRRHQAYFAALAEKAEPKLSTPEQNKWLNRLEREHDNLRVSLQRDGGNQLLRLQTACALTRFWMLRGFSEEGRRLLLQLQEGVPEGELTPSLRGKTANAAGVLSLTLADFDRAEPFFEQVLTLNRDLNDSSGIATALANLGIVAHQRGDLETASARYTESAELLRRVGDQIRLTPVLINLGSIEIARGNFNDAEAILQEVLTQQRETGDEASTADTLHNLGTAAYRRNDLVTARLHFVECLRLRLRVNDKVRLMTLLSPFIELAVAAAQFEEAARLIGAFHKGEEEIAMRLPPRERFSVEENAEKVQSFLGSGVYRLHYERGYGEELQQVFDNLLQK